MRLHLDFETRSTVDITKRGAWVYASHPSTDIICMGMAVDDGPVQVFRKDFVTRPPAQILADIIVAHNAQFEYAIWHFILHKKYGWPALTDPKRWDCTMARALMCGIPASLEGCALTLNAKFKKDWEGRQALLKICKPDPKTGQWNEDPLLYDRVIRYNALDVETERAVDKLLPPLPLEERKVFELDLSVNSRGVGIDLSAAAQAAEIAEKLTDGLNAELRTLTGGAVSKASKIAEMKRWVAAQGVPVPVREKKDKATGEVTEKETLDIEAVKDLIKDEKTPQIVKKVISIRQQVGKSSTAKYRSMLACACEDGRIRGSFQYHGGHTGRWAGRLVQFQNFPQGLVDADQERAIELLEQGADWFRLCYGSKAMQTLSDALRGMVKAAPGSVFVGADYASIEMRGLNWLAGEDWVLDLVRSGGSPYIRMAARIYGRDEKDISKKGTPKEYDIGKRSELGNGFGMGWIRFQANVYSETAKKGDAVEISDELAQRAVKIYRQEHPHVVEFWYATENAAINAVKRPGEVFATAGGKVLWGMSPDNRFLCCRLPSGRLLRYFRPSVRQEPARFNKAQMKDTLYYWGSASEGAIKTDCGGFLGWYRTWGGELVENVVQATCRDIMAGGAVNAAGAGFPIVLHAHDEILAEVSVSDKALTPDRLIQEMVRPPAWAAGFPIAAESIYKDEAGNPTVGRRYRK